ncbi:MAG: hypothetical protein ACYSU6_09345, partial [Planctomycetota bacterium]
MKNSFYDRSPEVVAFTYGRGDFCPSRFLPLIFILAGLLANVPAYSKPVVHLSDPTLRQQAVQALTVESQRRRAAAWEMAQNQGWIPKQLTADRIFELMAIRGGKIYFYRTCNVNAAISVGADLIRNTPPYNLNGAGLTVGIWDGGAARATHQELLGRVAVLDGASSHSHSTHVAGTIGAAGVVASALGMAPSVLRALATTPAAPIVPAT